MSILIIEDDPVAQKIISDLLEKNDYEPLQASSVKEAIKIIQMKHDIELIICDIMMPEADGFEFLEFKKSFLKYQNIPVLMSTVLGDKESIARSVALGANDYLVKPVKKEILLSKIEKLLQKAPNKILIVDDEEIILNVIKRSVQREGYETLTAKSAEEALDIIESHEINLAITDIMLPGMNGFELLIHIKENHPNIPVLIIAGQSGKFKKEDAIAAGADGYLSKPFRNTEIVRKIQGILNYKTSGVQK